MLAARLLKALLASNNMRFGARVIVTRGCNSCGTKWCANNKRDVPGVMIGALTNQIKVRLDYMDGPNDIAWQGNVMWFSKSQVRAK